MELPNVFRLRAVVNRGRHKLKVVEVEPRVEYIQGRLESEIVCLVCFHVDNRNDAADIGIRTAAWRMGLSALPLLLVKYLMAS